METEWFGVEDTRKYFSLSTYLSPEVVELLRPALECPLEFSYENIWSNKSECILDVDYLHSKIVKYNEGFNQIDFLSSSSNLSVYLDPIKLHLIANFDPKRHASRFLGSTLDLFASHVFSTMSPLAHLTLYSIFERSLGDLLFSLAPTRPVPFLLRDLLNETALDNLLGKQTMEFLKLLLCGPTSLNLRNLAWHGFLNPGQYPDRLAYFLIALVVFIDSKLTFVSITERARFNLANVRPLDVNREHVLRFKLAKRDEYHEAIDNSVLIDESRRDLWRKAVVELDNNNADAAYARMIILLPEIEHVMRKLYARAHEIETNSCQIAFTDEFYLTMDDLMNSTSQNRLVSGLLDSTLVVVMMDLFNYVDGPRIRDRLSHGEINNNKSANIIDFYFVDLLVIVAICLVSLPHRPRLIDSLSYEPNFHPIAVLRNQLIEFIHVEINYTNDLIE